MDDKNINNQIFNPTALIQFSKSNKKLFNTRVLIQNTILIRYKEVDFAVLAQLVEHSAVNRTVAGSSPADGAYIFVT